MVPDHMHTELVLEVLELAVDAGDVAGSITYSGRMEITKQTCARYGCGA